MSSYVISLEEIDKSKIGMVGGKGAALGELCKIEGVKVPIGFCVTTKAYKKITDNNDELKYLIDELSHLKIEDRDKIRELGNKIRLAIERISVPEDIERAITEYLKRFGENNGYAVRSSATYEDLPTNSFAGQQDTYLNIIGKSSILTHISKCWASLFTERAIIYRIQNGFKHHKALLSVIVQKMVYPEISGILFTADPVTSDRKVVSIDASFGIGESLVSGKVNPDTYKVRNGRIISKIVSVKKKAVHALKNGGTGEDDIEPDKQNQQVLTDEQILKLNQIARNIEKHFGCPQDIEWCLANNEFYIVQSRPITTLFPIPDEGTQENHVYVSVGHQQMMTDPIKPLGLSFFLLTTNAPMRKAGGRLFVDVTYMLQSPSGRETLLNNMGQHDPLIKDALMTIIEREDYIKPLLEDKKEQDGKNNRAVPTGGVAQIEINPSIVDDLIKKSQASIEELKKTIQSKSGVELLDFIKEDIGTLKKLLFDPQSMSVIMAAMNASAWINAKMLEWLGEKNAADVLTQSVPNNITSQMGLDLLDVADIIRPYPQIIEYLQKVKEDNFLDELKEFKGGQEVRDAIISFLSKYGMRCSGEIDITKPRFSEKPVMLVPMILSNINNFEPGESKRKFEQGLNEALDKEKELLDRLSSLPDGDEKVRETKKKIELVRNFIGYREYPKYFMVSRYFDYKQALLKEADKLKRMNVIEKIEDIYYLTFEELREVVLTNQLDYRIIDQRKGEYKIYEKLTPPRVITSDGEIVRGRYRRENIPDGAIAGLPVSSGIAEGRARVILNLEDANLENGDILVTAFTDPSWTPLFVSIKGLITEVGGLMTHGAVIAREYGLPAVVGVENATKLIKDGQRIRVNGTEGYVEFLE